MGGGQLFEDEDPLDGLDLKYLQDPTEADFRPQQLIGNRYYSKKRTLCSAGCGRPVSVYHYKNRTGELRKTCGSSECLQKITANRKGRHDRQGPKRRADYGTVLPDDEPFLETEITTSEIKRIINEADRKTWGL